MDTGVEVLAFLRDKRETMRARFAVTRIAMFGSVARGSSTAASDVDILVEMSEPTFDHYMDLKFFLEDNLGRPVDLVLADSLKPRLAPIIEREAIYA
jgi:uncharacterized protein